MIQRRFQLQLFPTDAAGSGGDPGAVVIDGELILRHDRIRIRYHVRDPEARVKFADTADTPGRRDELWQTTCFELFVRDADGGGYWEYNLAPSHHWNVYRFQGYRRHMQREQTVTTPALETLFHSGRPAGISAELPLPAALARRPLAIGVACVIEDRQGRMHYYALEHRRAQPDFHDPDSFVLRVTGSDLNQEAERLSS